MFKACRTCTTKHFNKGSYCDEHTVKKVHPPRKRIVTKKTNLYRARVGLPPLPLTSRSIHSHKKPIKTRTLRPFIQKIVKKKPKSLKVIKQPKPPADLRAVIPTPVIIGINRHCSQCHEDKDQIYFIRRSDRPWLFLAICRSCRNQRRRAHEKTHPQKNKTYVDIRNARRRGVCAWCWTSRGKMRLYVVDRITGLYHELCTRELQHLRGSKVELRTVLV